MATKKSNYSRNDIEKMAGYLKIKGGRYSIEWYMRNYAVTIREYHKIRKQDHLNAIAAQSAAEYANEQALKAIEKEKADLIIETVAKVTKEIRKEERAKAKAKKQTFASIKKSAMALSPDKKKELLALLAD